MTEPPELLQGRYRLHQVIGQGGMATVHRAFDEQTQHWVAIKLLAPALARVLSVQRRFAREAEVLQHLEHVNIVRLFSWHADRDMSFLVMELVDGRSLADWSLKNGAMTMRQAVLVALQICAGVQRAHEAGIVHRDIKPANILVDAQGVCKVVDFGLARGGEHERLTRTGITMGTFGFMAPEQIEDAASVTTAADVYSLGATLISLLAGRAFHDIRQGLDAVGDRVPLVLARALVNATLTNPEQRYQSIPQLEKTLRRALEHLPEQPTPPLHIPLFDDPPSTPPTRQTTAEVLHTILLDE